MMELKKAAIDANMPKKNSRKAAFASALLLVAGLMGCSTAHSPPMQTRTICRSFGVPPRDPAREELPRPYTEAEQALLQPPYSYVNCVTVEER